MVGWDLFPLQLFHNKYISFAYEGFFKNMCQKPTWPIKCTLTPSKYIKAICAIINQPPNSVEAPKSLAQQATIS